VVCLEKHWPLPVPAKSRFRCRPSGPGAVAHRLAGSAAASGDAELTTRVFFGKCYRHIDTSDPSTFRFLKNLKSYISMSQKIYL
jgi:hypothetical protein